ncbi:hypothetical protein CDEF62S_01502 [Castellaniella defragrans]
MDLNGSAARQVADDIAGNGGKAFSASWDLADHNQAAHGLDGIRKALGEVDVLVNVTGGPPPGPAAGVPLADWEKHFHSMVLSVIHLTDLVLPGIAGTRLGPCHHQHLVRRGGSRFQTLGCPTP